MNIRTLFAAASLSAFVSTPVPAAGTETVKPVEEVTGGTRLGTLDCTIEGGWGMLIGSSKKADCSFARTDGVVETYAGTLEKLGIDIGKTETAVMTWAVFTNSPEDLAQGALLGSYSGVSGEVSLGIGLGANALIGGTARNIGLQPLAIQGASGVNLAVGLAALNLETVAN